MISLFLDHPRLCRCNWEITGVVLNNNDRNSYFCKGGTGVKQLEIGNEVKTIADILTVKIGVFINFILNDC